MGDKTNGGNIPSTLGRERRHQRPFSLNVMLTSPYLFELLFGET